MRKIAIILFVSICLMFTGSIVMANTVTVNLQNFNPAGINVSAFQLFFNLPDGNFGWPVELDTTGPTPTSDFDLQWGPTQPPLGFNSITWGTLTLIDPVDDDVDRVRAITASANSLAAPRLVDGLLLTMSSVDTKFGVNINDPSNVFFDFTDTAIPDLQISEVFNGDDQVVNINAVPIPGSILLLGSGLVGLIGIARRKRS